MNLYFVEKSLARYISIFYKDKIMHTIYNMGYDTATNINVAYIEHTEPSFQYATYIGTQ